VADEELNPTPPANFPKQAVVVIHGMGEQQPMDTITAFVRAAWQDEPILCSRAASWCYPYP
jgi:hypothetical protein